MKEKRDRREYAPDARWYQRPICWLNGHDRPEDDLKPGWFATYCQRCGKSFPDYKLSDYVQRYRSRLASYLLALANFIYGSGGSTYSPHFRAIDQQLPGIGTEHSCAAYSYEHIASLIKQYKDDGLPEPLLGSLISEDGWVSITEENAVEMTDLINKSLEAESNRQEREKTMVAAGLIPDPNKTQP